MPIDWSILPFGREELNLIEVPWTTLTPGKRGGRQKTIRTDNWIVTGSDEYGLPGPKALEVYWGLVSLSRARGFRRPLLRFSSYDLLTAVLGWPPNGASYAALQRSLRELCGVTLYCRNWRDKDGKTQELGCGILDGYGLYQKRGRRPVRTNYVIFDGHLFRSLADGYCKDIDWGILRELGRPTAKRLYSYLDKHLYRKPTFSIRLSHLCTQYLGLRPRSGPRKDSAAWKVLKPALAELVDSRVILEPEVTRGRTEWLLNFRRAERPPGFVPERKRRQAERTAEHLAELRAEYDRWYAGQVDAAALPPDFDAQVLGQVPEPVRHGQPRNFERTVAAIRRHMTAELLQLPDFDTWRRRRHGSRRRD